MIMKYLKTYKVFENYKQLAYTNSPTNYYSNNIAYIMKYPEMEENYKTYTEIEFVCYNSEYNNIGDTTKENQLLLYKDLDKIDNILPYIQDWSDDNVKQRSLAVVILDQENENELKDVILKYAKDRDIKIDLEDKITPSKINSIIRQDLENLVIID